jgi:predicted dehydrogenase
LSETLGVACIGCGGIARKQHLKNLVSIPRYRLIATVDVVEERARGCAQEFGASFHAPRMEEVLDREEIGAVLICTPPESHVPLATQAARAGKHVFLEKPMGMTGEECEELERAVGEAGIKLMVGFCYRFNPAVELARQVVAEPAFSLAHVMSGTEGSQFSYIFHNLCHAADLLCWWHGAEPSRITAGGSGRGKREPAGVDRLAAVIEFENGTAAVIVVGGGSATLSLPKWLYKVCGGEGVNCEVWNYQYARFFPDSGLNAGGEEWYHKGHRKELELFAEAVLTDTPSPVPPAAGTRAARITEKVLASWARREGGNYAE